LDKNAEAQLNKANAGEIRKADCIKDKLTGAWRFEDPDKSANSACHQFEGQNVLFNDSHVAFEKTPVVGLQNDNIYRYWTLTSPTECDRMKGGETPKMVTGNTAPKDDEDAYLVNELNK
jgi:hypothetical protein